MVHDSPPHRATPRAAKWCAHDYMREAHERTRDRGLAGGYGRGRGERDPVTGGVACCYLDCIVEYPRLS